METIEISVNPIIIDTVIDRSCGLKVSTNTLREAILHINNDPYVAIVDDSNHTMIHKVLNRRPIMAQEVIINIDPDVGVTITETEE